MYKIKGRDSNGNRFKIKTMPVNNFICKEVYRLSTIKTDGTISHKIYQSTYAALVNAIEDTDQSNTVTLKIKIKGSDKRIEVVGGNIKGDIIRSTQYCVFIDDAKTFDRYNDIEGLAIGLYRLITETEFEVEYYERVSFSSKSST